MYNCRISVNFSKSYIRMARQAGIIKLVGRINNLCFYKMGDEYYVRTKSSLTGKRVKRDPAFTLTMVHARLMGQASKMASELYRQLPAGQRERKMFQQLTGKLFLLLKRSVPPDIAFTMLQMEYIPATIVVDAADTGQAHINSNPNSIASFLPWVDHLLEEVFGVVFEVETDTVPP